MARRRLLAGSWGPERIPPRPDPDDADWYLPLHVQDAAAARRRVAAQVAGGADAVVAPTWLTHRHALLPLGETRRAAAWTADAVRVAREGVELGLEEREEQLAEAPADDVRRGRPLPLVAASLPALPRDAATEHDYRDQAGIVADAEPDLLLVEGQPSAPGARTAVSEAVDTGLPVWAAIQRDAVAWSPVETWLEWGRHIGLGCLLLPLEMDPSVVIDGHLPWGVTAAASEGLDQRLATGASVVAVLDGADVARLGPIRAAIDDHESGELETARIVERRWQAGVERAAAMAPAGPAVWLGHRPEGPLPEGFVWLVIPVSEARRLPAGHYRLIVAPDAVPDVTAALDHGGILVAPLAAGPRSAAGLQLLAVDEALDPPLVFYRRES